MELLQGSSENLSVDLSNSARSPRRTIIKTPNRLSISSPSRTGFGRSRSVSPLGVKRSSPYECFPAPAKRGRLTPSSDGQSPTQLIENGGKNITKPLVKSSRPGRNNNGYNMYKNKPPPIFVNHVESESNMSCTCISVKEYKNGHVHQTSENKKVLPTVNDSHNEYVDQVHNEEALTSVTLSQTTTCSDENTATIPPDRTNTQVSIDYIRPRCKAPLNMSTLLLSETYRNIPKKHMTISEDIMQKKVRKAGFYSVVKDEILNSKYKVIDFLGKGSFGQVVKAQCLDANDNNGESMVAIKIIRKSVSFLNQGRREVQILKTINNSSRDKGTNFIVKFIEEFMHEGHLCIVFELLSHSLLDLVNLTLHADPLKPGLSLRMVHKLTHQLLCVLATLEKMQIIHCDLKPENVALTSPNRAHIKVLDFGSSCSSSENVCNLYPYIQSRYYRAPEILLGCRYGYPIDMWSLGCIIVELFTARPLFTGQDSVQQLYSIMDVIGEPPPQNMLREAVYLKRYFRHVNGHLVPRQEYKWKEKRLVDIIYAKSEDLTYLNDFYDLVKKMLTYDPDKRIKPYQALQHPFITSGPAFKNKVIPPPPPENPFSRPRISQIPPRCGQVPIVSSEVINQPTSCNNNDSQSSPVTNSGQQQQQQVQATNSVTSQSVVASAPNPTVITCPAIPVSSVGSSTIEPTPQQQQQQTQHRVPSGELQVPKSEDKEAKQRQSPLVHISSCDTHNGFLHNNSRTIKHHAAVHNNNNYNSPQAQLFSHVPQHLLPVCHPLHPPFVADSRQKIYSGQLYHSQKYQNSINYGTCDIHQLSYSDPGTFPSTEDSRKYDPISSIQKSNHHRQNGYHPQYRLPNLVSQDHILSHASNNHHHFRPQPPPNVQQNGHYPHSSQLWPQREINIPLGLSLRNNTTNYNFS